MSDLIEFLRDCLDEDAARAVKARDFDYAQCGVWEARGPYPAASGEADGVLRPRGNLRAEIGKDDIFVEAELPWDLIPHMARHDPARVLREVEAKRAIVDAYLPPGEDPHPGMPCTDDAERDSNGEIYAETYFSERGACVRHVEASKRLLHHDYVLRLLALPYADHPGYKQDWAPKESGT